MTAFAFYGRVSTEDQQDPTSSKAWQMRRSLQLIEPAGGQVVTEFFDVGQSRSLPWKRRPEAAALLAALADPDRGFDAVVVGEPARAFYGGQFGLTFPVFTHYGVELWVPEVGGCVDPGSDAHEMLMSLYGGMSKGERNRVKIRVKSAMSAQAATEGRFLGGRPPYGYVLGDAGPHPNPGKAQIGQRLHRLELDPVAAPVVRRIFDEYLAGSGLYAIAEQLTADGIPSPSGHDPARNRHRQSSAGAWSKRAIGAILANPRYTGRQVWNRQRRDEVLVDVEDVAAGHESKLRWNDRADWIWSAEQVHDPIISAEDFARAEDRRTARRRPESTAPKARRAQHPYALRRMIRCGICGRAMEASWNNGRAHYRCKYGVEYAAARELDHPRTVYVREDLLVPALDRWLAEVFAPGNFEQAVADLVAGAETDLVADAKAAAARRKLADCDSRLAKHRAALEAGVEPAIIGQWMAEVRVERERAEFDLARARPVAAVDADAVHELLAGLGDLAGAIADMPVADKAEAYAGMGLEVVYNPSGPRCTASLTPCGTDRVGGGT